MNVAVPDAPPVNVQPPAGGKRAIIEAVLAGGGRGRPATLAVVVETIGSTYVRTGALALFGGASGQVGWLSGGCLEPEIAVRAAVAADEARIEWMDIDTREDEDLFSGSAVGCRGRLRLALVPIAAMPGFAVLAEAWLDRRGALGLQIDASGQVAAEVGSIAQAWQLDASALAWSTDAGDSRTWRVELAMPPAVVILGGGPESALLVPLLRAMGWMTTLVERRARWIAQTDHADHALHADPGSVVTDWRGAAFDAALVMHHNFELDREALAVLAEHPVRFIGLLGPNRRREDLFSVLTPAARAALTPRLRSPIGLKLGGHGPEAIALSIAAQLQAWQNAP